MDPITMGLIAGSITAGAGLAGNLSKQRQSAKIAAKEMEEERYQEARERLAELFQMNRKSSAERDRGQQNAFQSLMESYSRVLS